MYSETYQIFKIEFFAPFLMFDMVLSTPWFWLPSFLQGQFNKDVGFGVFAFLEGGVPILVLTALNTVYTMNVADLLAHRVKYVLYTSFFKKILKD